MRQLRSRPALSREALQSLGEGLRAVYEDVTTATSRTHRDLLQRLDDDDAGERKEPARNDD
jgi:hypothetical protein